MRFSQSTSEQALRLAPRRAVAEHLGVGEELLVDLEADPQPNLSVINGIVHTDPLRRTRRMITTNGEIRIRN